NVPLVVCNPDFAVWQIGTRTVWSPVRNLDIGLEILYTRLEQNHVGTWLTGQGTRPGGEYTARDQDTWSGTIRFQRNFWP
ncbi:MAG TPA: porin, partial [Xanthobacteraceae bacterium]|nr:porin [Xanthobacteraceae bacterium]